MARYALFEIELRSGMKNLLLLQVGIPSESERNAQPANVFELIMSQAVCESVSRVEKCSPRPAKRKLRKGTEIHRGMPGVYILLLFLACVNDPLP